MLTGDLRFTQYHLFSVIINVISECVDGFHGNYCNFSCGHCNKTFPRCSQRNGHCLYGCESNYWKLPECEGLNINCIIKTNEDISWIICLTTLQQTVVGISKKKIVNMMCKYVLLSFKLIQSFSLAESTPHAGKQFAMYLSCAGWQL